MDVLLTGGSGTVGTAITDHLADRDEYEITSIDPEQHPDPAVESVEADVGDYDAIRPHFEGKDAVVHLAHVSQPAGGPWERAIQWNDEHGTNLQIHANAYAAAVDTGVGTFVYASSNHAVGMYEVEHAPEVYYPDYDLVVDHAVQPRPDSMYGAEKVYAEGLGRLAADAHDVQVYALRICAVRDPEYDHPYGDAEGRVDRGEFERGSDQYATQVARMKCMWQSRRDHAHMVERCFADDSVGFDVFYGVSDNDRRWFDIEHARDVLGYEPQDNGEDWDAPPE